MKQALEFFACFLICWGILMFGLLHAFWPINDKETSTAHRVLWLLLTAAAIVFCIYKAVTT